MKKIYVISISIILIIVSIIALKSYNESKIRPDIYNNSKAYHELLVKAVKNLKENGTENKKLSNDIGDFYYKYESNKITKKEEELLNSLLSETVDYQMMMSYKEKEDTKSFNKCLPDFERNVREISNYFK